MRREALISSILQELRYNNVNPYSDAWEQVSNQVDIVVRELLMTGEYVNFTRKILNVTQETDPVVLENFIRYQNVYNLPSDFGSLETRREEYDVGYFRNSYYLCTLCRPVVQIEYQMKPDFEDFSWCDPLLLAIIIKETATRMEAILGGYYAQFVQKKNEELIQKAKRVKTNRVRFRVGSNYPYGYGNGRSGRNGHAGSGYYGDNNIW